MTGALTADNPRGDGHYTHLLSLANQICVALRCIALHLPLMQIWAAFKAARRWYHRVLVCIQADDRLVYGL